MGPVLPSPSSLSQLPVPVCPHTPTASGLWEEAPRLPSSFGVGCSYARPPLDGTFSPTQGWVAAALAPGGEGAPSLSPPGWCGCLVETRREGPGTVHVEPGGFPLAGGEGNPEVSLRLRAAARRGSPGLLARVWGSLNQLSKMRVTQTSRAPFCTVPTAGPSWVHLELQQLDERHLPTPRTSGSRVGDLTNC